MSAPMFDPLTDLAIEDRVTYHAPSEGGVERHRMLSEVVALSMRTVRDLCPNCREASLALTKLEEAKMWASAAVARHEETR